MKEKEQENQGLYTPQLESDACGIGMIADLNGTKSHSTVADALTILERMEHRGACGCEEDSGDGAGILLQIPHEFLESEMRRKGVQLPESSAYGVGVAFLPQNPIQGKRCMDVLAEKFAENDMTVLGYRTVPVKSSILGTTSRSTAQRQFVVHLMIAVKTFILLLSLHELWFIRGN